MCAVFLGSVLPAGHRIKRHTHFPSVLLLSASSSSTNKMLFIFMRIFSHFGVSFHMYFQIYSGLHCEAVMVDSIINNPKLCKAEQSYFSDSVYEQVYTIWVLTTYFFLSIFVNALPQ